MQLFVGPESMEEASKPGRWHAVNLGSVPGDAQKAQERIGRGLGGSGGRGGAIANKLLNILETSCLAP